MLNMKAIKAVAIMLGLRCLHTCAAMTANTERQVEQHPHLVQALRRAASHRVRHPYASQTQGLWRTSGPDAASSEGFDRIRRQHNEECHAGEGHVMWQMPNHTSLVYEQDAPHCIDDGKTIHPFTELTRPHLTSCFSWKSRNRKRPFRVLLMGDSRLRGTFLDMVVGRSQASFNASRATTQLVLPGLVQDAITRHTLPDSSGREHTIDYLRYSGLFERTDVSGTNMVCGQERLMRIFDDCFEHGAELDRIRLIKMVFARCEAVGQEVCGAWDVIVLGGPTWDYLFTNNPYLYAINLERLLTSLKLLAPDAKFIISLPFPIGLPGVEFQGSSDSRANRFPSQMVQVWNPMLRAAASRHSALVLDAYGLVLSYPIQPLPIHKLSPAAANSNQLHIHADAVVRWQHLKGLHSGAFDVSIAISQRLNNMICFSLSTQADRNVPAGGVRMEGRQRSKRCRAMYPAQEVGRLTAVDQKACMYDPPLPPQCKALKCPAAQTARNESNYDKASK